MNEIRCEEDACQLGMGIVYDSKNIIEDDCGVRRVRNSVSGLVNYVNTETCKVVFNVWGIEFSDRPIINKFDPKNHFRRIQLPDGKWNIVSSKTGDLVYPQSFDEIRISRAGWGIFGRQGDRVCRLFPSKNALDYEDDGIGDFLRYRK